MLQILRLIREFHQKEDILCEISTENLWTNKLVSSGAISDIYWEQVVDVALNMYYVKILSSPEMGFLSIIRPMMSEVFFNQF
jgi:hypothetical protein